MINKPMRVTDPERDLIIIIRALKVDPNTIASRLMLASLPKEPVQDPAADIKFKPIDSSKRVIPRS